MDSACRKKGLQVICRESGASENAMITRVYVDNYKCMVNFEHSPASLQLVFGENGSGKSTVFEILGHLRDLVVRGAPVEQVLPRNTLTAWQSRREQAFELDIKGNGGGYTYSLRVEHHEWQGKNRIVREELRFDGMPLYRFDGQDAHLYRDDASAGPVFPQDWSRSGVALVPERHDNQRLCWFRQRMAAIYVLAIDPLRMDDATSAEQQTPDAGVRNFASWYRHLTQDSPERMGSLFESLREVIDGFTWVKLTQEGEAGRVLRVGFECSDVGQGEEGEYDLKLSQLSDGHRSLIALFTILHCAVRPDVTICIDEPDNFVALRELQPWVTELSDRVEEERAQCLLISHHPELIDLLAVRHGARFVRSAGGPVRIKPVEWSQGDGLRLSEIVARGWEE